VAPTYNLFGRSKRYATPPAASVAMQALDAAGMADFSWDLTHDRFMVGERMSALTGIPQGAKRVFSCTPAEGFVHPDDVSTLRRMVDGLSETDGRFEVRFRVRGRESDRLLWVEASGAGVRGPDGRIDTLIGVLRDVSAGKKRDDEGAALVAELDHRIKNVLASVQSLAAQSARRTVSLDAFLKTFFGRLEAMAAAHALLTATRWRGAEISHIAAAELGALAFGQARWSGPEMVLNARATNTLTLALHELAANAVKYGALSTDTGRVEVKWAPLPNGGFSLEWLEINGPSVTAPSRRGFGSTLLDRVTGPELGGRVEMDFRPTGLRALFTADASALSVGPPATLGEARAMAELGGSETATGESAGERDEDDISGLTILIVEDAVLLALELEAGLVEAGARIVGSATNIEEAKRMVGLKFDVAVLDANLNGRSVLPIAHALAARKIPFIFATGYDETDVAPEGFHAPVVRKPYNVRQIAAALVQALAAAA